MESGTYEILFTLLGRIGEKVGEFSMLGGTLMDMSPDLEEELQHKTLEEIFRVYGNSPYYTISKA